MMNTLSSIFHLRSSVFCLLVLGTCPASAQKIVAEKTTVEVGRTAWKQPITAVFEFKIKGSRKVRIEKVRPDCSCTIVDYPLGDLSDKFQIKMTYDAKLLGHFDKQAAVYTNASDKPIYICMKGQVLEHYVDLSAHYPVEMGDLRLSTNELEFDDVNKGDRLEQELRIYNNGNQTYHPNLMHLPPYLSATVEPEELHPLETGTIMVTLNSEKLHNYGLTQSSVYLAGNPGDKVRSDHEIGVSAVLLPSFSETIQNPPAIQLSTEVVNLAFEGKAKKKEVIDIVNTGRSELRITSLQMFTRGLKISLDKSRLMPGESTKLKITGIRDDLKKARTRPRILMITNDPQKPKVTIIINADNTNS